MCSRIPKSPMDKGAENPRPIFAETPAMRWLSRRFRDANRATGTT